MNNVKFPTHVDAENLRGATNGHRTTSNLLKMAQRNGHTILVQAGLIIADKDPENLTILGSTDDLSEEERRELNA